MALLATLALVCSTTCLAVLLRLAFLLVQQSQEAAGRRRGVRPRKPDETSHVAVFLGSGGHTTEMLQLLEALPRQRYTPRTYIVSRGDQFSVAKARQAELRQGNAAAEQGNGDDEATIGVIELPRARKVHQTWLSTPISVMMAFASCVWHIAMPQRSDSRGDEIKTFADAIIMNGPGTCVPIVAAVWLLRMLGRPSPRLIYVESFARVKSLSLTAKIVRHLVDTFIVQWPDALTRGAQYRGWLV